MSVPMTEKSLRPVVSRTVLLNHGLRGRNHIRSLLMWVFQQATRTCCF